MSEQLLRRAKTVKSKCENRPVSSFDFHVLIDSSAADLARIENQLATSKSEFLFLRPFVLAEKIVAEVESGNVFDRDQAHWAKHRSVKRLETAIKQMRKDDQDAQIKERVLPGTLLHRLRATLFLGKADSDASLRLIADKHWKNLRAGGLVLSLIHI